MPISLSCSGCKKTLKIADNLAGKRAKCPGCQTLITIPTPAAPQPAPPAPKKDSEDWGLAPLDDEPPPKPKATSPKPAPTAAKTPAAKPVAAAPSKPAPQPAAAKPKTPVANPPSSDLDDFGLAPLDVELFSKPSAKPAPAPAKAPAKPAAAQPAAKQNSTPTAKPAPKAAAPKADLENMLLAPLDDLLSDPKPSPKPAPVAKPGAQAVAKTAAPNTKPAKPPAPAKRSLAEEDEEQDFNLAPLADLSHDPLGAALPMAAAANPLNPYAAPQTLLTVNPSSANVASLPVWKTVREFFQLYSENIANSALLGIKMLGINIFYMFAVFAVLYTFIRLAIAVKMSVLIFKALWLLIFCTVIIAWFCIQCWLSKGLLNYGYCVAMDDKRGAEGALTSPGSLLHFIVTGFLNALIIVLFGALFLGAGFFIHLALLLPGVMALGILANLICLNFYYYFHREVNCISVFFYWWNLVKPHLLKYALLLWLMNFITMILALGMMLLSRLVLPSILRELQPYLPDDPTLVMGLTGLLLNGIMLGIFGSYYSILQGVCFKQMLRINEREYE